MDLNKTLFIDTVIDPLLERMKCCDLCPRNCGVNRLENEKGICNTGRNAMVSSFGPHFGEESCLVGTHGSGTIFFTNCNLLCNFCQNFEISHQGRGQEVSDEDLADIMLHLQFRGCHNINLVSPSHVIPQIVSALKIAIEKGLGLPVVYNTGGYDQLDSIRALEGIVDIYMPDIKFSESAVSYDCCDAPDYFEVVKKAVIEMHRQTGDLEIDRQKIARKGVLIRHLVMPGDLAGTSDVMTFIASEISVDSYVNIMSQYNPSGKVLHHPILGRRVNSEEYNYALAVAKSRGLYRFGQDED